MSQFYQTIVVETVRGSTSGRLMYLALQIITASCLLLVEKKGRKITQCFSSWRGLQAVPTPYVQINPSPGRRRWSSWRAMGWLASCPGSASYLLSIWTIIVVTFLLLRRGSSLMCTEYIWPLSVGPCLLPSLKEHLQLFTTANTWLPCSKTSGETFISTFHLTMEALGSHMFATISGFMWILGIQSQILTPVWQAHYTPRSSSSPSFLFFLSRHSKNS